MSDEYFIVHNVQIDVSICTYYVYV